MLLNPYTLLLWIFAVSQFLIFGGFALISLHEGEQRAACLSALMSLVGALVFVLVAQLTIPIQELVVAMVLLALCVAIVLFCLPVGKVDISRGIPLKRVDERDIMFARAKLIQGTPEFEAYYSLHPDNKRKDDLTRTKPGLLSLKATYANPLLFASSVGSYTLTEALHSVVDGPVSGEKFSLQPVEMTQFVKDLARYYGALDVGVTELKPYHVYSHVGRGPYVYGEPVVLEHHYAIAFTVEMDFAMLGANPQAPGVVESARQYVEAARVAVPLAGAIRQWGYAARAHIDGDYRVICPLVARDAGLGEIGRMGLLMTPHRGPRVRLAVVTTELELVPDRPTRDASVIDFCTICKKCAQNCPVKAIPFSERGEIDGALRWQINPDLCFRYWNVVGTDCGRCISVCPYAHPASFYHHLVRWGNARSGAFRRLALWLDDLFYGKQHPPRRPPAWTRLS